VAANGNSSNDWPAAKHTPHDQGPHRNLMGMYSISAPERDVQHETNLASFSTPAQEVRPATFRGPVAGASLQTYISTYRSKGP
jgi:hypothetical protein